MVIKNCPFCGSIAKVKKAYPEECVDIPFPYYYVKCTSDNCGAEMGNGEYSPEEAIEKWNQRVQKVIWGTYAYYR